MAAIPKNVEALAERIYDTYVRDQSPDRLTRIGASGIGDECVRAIWFDWRGAYKSNFDGRLLRLFQTGHIQEDRILKDLANAGFEVWPFQENGDQWTHVGADGHFVAKLDGMIRGVPGAEKTIHTLEIKTSSKKGFDEMVKHGVQKSKPEHYAQMQSGMMLGGFKDALYIMINKDNEALYCERVKADPEAFENIEYKLRVLTSSDIAPPRITEKEDDWRCKFCDAKPVCWGKEPPLQNCRTCAHSRIASEGQWACDKLTTIRSAKEQLAGCDLWVSLL